MREQADVNGARGTPAASSLRGLDALSFLMADVRDGLGPFLSVYLKGTQHWPSGQIGVVMAVSGVAGALAQIPAGMLVDAARAKRLILALSALCVAVGSLLIARFPSFASVLMAQAAIGLASALIPPCLAALSLGIVGHRAMPARVSRNEGLNHGGNFIAAILAGVLGQYVGVMWLFYLVCAFSAASAAAVLLIRPADIDHELARGGETLGESPGESPSIVAHPMPLRTFWCRCDIWKLLIAVTLFHFGNAAMLPLAGQVIALAHPGADVIALSACVVMAQLVMGVVALGTGQALRRGVGHKTIFLWAFALLPVRGVLFSMTSSPLAVVGIQLFDGVAAGIFGVMAIVMMASLTRGTGRFNLAQGAMALAIGAGAALSNLTGGLVAEHIGFAAAFLVLAGIGTVALAFFATFAPVMPAAGTGNGSRDAHDVA